MDILALGRLLEERRELVGIPRTELARRIGVTTNYVWTIERARVRKGGKPSQPSADLLARWAAALGWEESELATLRVLAGHQAGRQDQQPMPFIGIGALHFPQPRRMERDQLDREFQELLDNAEASEDQWRETVDLLRSFLDWMRFRLEKVR